MGARHGYNLLADPAAGGGGGGGGSVDGTTAHDAAGGAVNPVAVGGYASAAAPANVSADVDIVRLWCLRSGAVAIQPTFGGVLQATGNGIAGTDTPRVTIASDNSPLSVVGIQGVEGTAAHDAAGAAVEPVAVGGFASAAAPADVSADVDVVRAWCLRNGARAIQPTFAGVLATTGNGVAGTGVQRVTIASDNSPVPVSGPLTDAQLRATVVPVSNAGTTAHDAAGAAVNPVSVGGYASAAAPADVSADVDVVRAWCLRNGARAIQPTFAGVLATTGNGVAGTGVQRVTIASDNSPVPVSGPLTDAQLRATVVPVSNAGTTAHDAAGAAVNPVSVGGYASAAAPADVSADVDVVRAWCLRNGARAIQPTFAGVLATTGNGVAGTGVQRVTIASDNTAFSVNAVQSGNWTGRLVGNAGGLLDAVAGAAAPANAIYSGGRVATSNPTNEANGDIAPVMLDKAGRVVVTQGAPRELQGSTQTAIASTTETTIVAAAGASIFRDLVALIITTTGAAAQTITIRSGTAGTTKLVLNYPNAALAPGNPMRIMFPRPLRMVTANQTWTAQQSAATSCNYTAIWEDNL